MPRNNTRPRRPNSDFAIAPSERKRILLRLANQTRNQLVASIATRVSDVTEDVAPTRHRRNRGYGTPWTVEFVIVMLRQLVPTAEPASVTEPLWTFVQWPPVLPVMVVSATVRVPP